MNMRTPRDAIRISCLAATHSGDWLHATPSQKLGLWLQNTDFVRFRSTRSCGLSVCSDNTGTPLRANNVRITWTRS